MDELEKYREATTSMKEKFNQFTYYFIIGIASFLAVAFLPFIGSTAGLEWALPDTTIGWVIYVVTKLIMAGLNILIFHSFMQQAKINVKDHPAYKEANEILGSVKLKIYNPRSPKTFNSSEYGKKGTTIFVTTILASVALTQAILTYNVATLLSYIFTIVMGVIFGVMQMFKAEVYWTEEYLDFAKKIKKEQENYGNNN